MNADVRAEGEEDGRRSRVTIRQVAEQAGVSIATVSRWFPQQALQLAQDANPQIAG